MSPFNFKMWIQCTPVNMSQKFKFGKLTYNFWFTSISFGSTVQSSWLLNWITIPLNCKSVMTTSQQNHCNNSFSLAALSWTLFLCWHPLGKPVCALKGNTKFLNFHLTAGHRQHWGIQCLPNISRISLAEPKQSWGFMSPAYLYTYFVSEFTLDFRKPCFTHP